jgi:adenine-specific DNA-methyltransferase
MEIRGACLSFKISQRRYLGNKNSLLEFISEIIEKEIESFYSFCDLFAGTGTVGNHFNSQNRKVISNDLLYQNYISISAFLNDKKFNRNKIEDILKELNSLEPHHENYFSKHFGDRYFSKEVAKKIGSIREEIRSLFKNSEISTKEKQILVTSLIYSMDRIANTVGHYDAYIKKPIREQKLNLEMLEIDLEKNQNNEVHNCNANKLIRDIECDILYLDPPYNSRQYSDAYHLLENLAYWEKPEVFGVAKKFDRSKIKSDYNKANATEVFRDLIENAKAKYILLSYNNMGNKGNSRSNARIEDKDILEILGNRGEVKIFEKEFKEYNTGKKKRENNIERIFLVEVEK